MYMCMCIEPKNALNNFCETILLLCIINKEKKGIKNVKCKTSKRFNCYK